MTPPSSFLLALSATLLPAAAQDPSAGAGDYAGFVVSAADADGDGAIDPEEWSRFVAAWDAEAEAAIDRKRFKLATFVALVDVDRDGRIAEADLDAMLADLDRNGDGALSGREMRGFGGRGGTPAAFRSERAIFRMILLRRADADGDGEVSSAEWVAFQGEGGAEAIDDDALLAWIAAEEAQPPSQDRNAMNTGVMLLTIESGLDVSGDGRFDRADLEAAFAALDANADGTLAADELRPPRARGGQGFGGGGWHVPTPEDYEKPPLMPWQRNLEDALAIVAATGRPLLICVNMDDETASDSLAYRRYRDPAFAELARGFVPLIVSPDRRVNDHDDRGRRVPDPRFGRVIDSEAIGIEPVLFERYFSGTRVAPRHLGVAPDGDILFDIYLVQDPAVIDAALREQGRPGPAEPDPGTLAEAELLRGRDAALRDELEARFPRYEANDRARLAWLALSRERDAQHPEIVRLALRDPAAKVREAAVLALAMHPGSVPNELWYEAFRVAAGRPELRFVLVESAFRHAAATGEASAEALARNLAGLAEPLPLDVARWTLVLKDAPARFEAPLDPLLLDALFERIARLERSHGDEAADPETALRLAETMVTCGRTLIQEGRDPTYVLEDARSYAGLAVDAEATRPHGLAWEARASWLLGDFATAADLSARALPELRREGAGPLVAETLRVLGQARTRQIYAALSSGEAWQPEWLAQARAAFEVLLVHPAATEADATTWLDLLRPVGGRAEEGRAVRLALERFPTSERVHAALRGQTLRDRGASALLATYAELQVPAEAETTVRWFGALAALIAAEHRMRCLEPEDALSAYLESAAEFRALAEEEPAFADSSLHYATLALAGAARVQADAGRLDEAILTLVEGVEARPASAEIEDGLGNSPRATGTWIRYRLRQAGREEDAEALRDRLRELGAEDGE